MPIYDYACADCGHRFEQRREMGSNSRIKCPACGSSAVNKQISMPALIRNSGTPQGGYTCCGRSERCDSPPCSADGQCRR